MKNASCYKKRLFLLSAFFGAWLLLIPLRIFYFIGPGRTETVLRGEELARQSGLLPAIRGRIITRDGHILAWNERFFDLECAVPLSPELRSFLTSALSRELLAEEKTICRGLSAAEFSVIRKSARRYPELKIVPRVERCYTKDARLHVFLGRCEWQNNRLTGISGIEKQYDDTLAGESGQYEVMLDRYRNWIKRSLRFRRKPRHGHNLYLNHSLAELTAQEVCP